MANWNRLWSAGQMRALSAEKSAKFSKKMHFGR
jgi:hypothetical protein